ncbi:hypothetical protein RSOLAG22IIIB_03665 [Rhizoctonia solani]|uniref:Cryptic loci regulator 2 N-terminal domain-containing protein n=1 Tax=Rhizoctonia solani TaxID=456999 RepID=A0A0K6FRB2_9AGAM|nr:hypothetical protein RSOLAG22IIIB_03665 [Rhizoctonia solani]
MTSTRDPSVVSISSTEDSTTEVVEISSEGTPTSHITLSPTPSPISNMPYHLVTGHTISWAYSDGVNTLPDLSNESSTHYHELVEPGSKSYQKYLEKVGTYVAKSVFGYTDAPYFMEDLPTGYSLYSCHTQPQSTGRPRKDLYLYGPENIKKFRSPNEFTMHAVWLMGGGPSNPSLCQCIHCSTHNSQIEINRRYGLPGRHDPRDHHHHS